MKLRALGPAAVPLDGDGKVLGAQAAYQRVIGRHAHPQCALDITFASPCGNTMMSHASRHTWGGLVERFRRNIDPAVTK